MTDSNTDMRAMSDAQLAAHLAREAGRILMNLRESGTAQGKELGRQGDRLANRFLVESLRKARSEDGLLSEEEADAPERLGKSRVWIIDPLDGTREYGEGRSDWAVHVALAENGKAGIGAVALPGLEGGKLLRSDQPEPLLPAPDRPRLLISRTRPARQALALAQALDGELIEMGSAGAKAMAVVRSEAEIYLHSGGQYEWDNCAPVAVAQAHGLHCSRIDGSPLVYNQPDPSLPDLLICRPQWADRVLALLAAMR